MPLAWNEIRARAIAFSREWENESSEDAEAKSFWDAFFNVFGVSRRRIASFEEPVRRNTGNGYIDLLWKGVLLVEHKSRGRNLDRAADQAFSYFEGLKERDLPRYVVVSDFARIKLYDLDTDKTLEFPLGNLHRNIKAFGFIAGYQTQTLEAEDSVSVKAAEKLGGLHDQLLDTGYEGHQLEVMLVRLLFCLFAEDTGIFERCQFTDYLTQRSAEDGSDLGMHIAQLFQVLNTPTNRRQSSLDEQLQQFPYVNGGLFAETIPLASFTSEMREALLDCGAVDWGYVSPAVLGSLFQSVMDKAARRAAGAHYTTEANILKALRPLFLDDLRAEFERVRRDQRKLRELHEKLGKIRIFDPACGCGNFLVLAYRELRLIELDILRELYVLNASNRVLAIETILYVDVDQFYGLEIDEFPAQIAQVALWLMDHQMNMRVSEEFGQYYARLPLTKSATILNENALRYNWESVISPERLNYIVGNPPFIGSKLLTDSQKEDVGLVFNGVRNAGLLDYVSCWYWKAAQFMERNPSIRTAFVSTNSITQGEQVVTLWPSLLAKGIKIQFAHRTFQWTSEARGKAAVHCAIIGFGIGDARNKTIYYYDTPTGEPHGAAASNISPYLIEFEDVLALGRTSALSAPQPLVNGSIPADGGNLILLPDAKDELLAAEPDAGEWIHRYMGAEDLVHSQYRYCLWLVGCPPNKLAQLPLVKQRVSKVREMRLASPKAATKEKAAIPTLFTENRQPTSGEYLAVPRTSSENRPYIPIGFVSSEVIAANDLQIVPNATLYTFGVLSSQMHMAWMRVTSGRMKSDYRYSSKYTYNTFPWPVATAAQKEAIERAARKVLEAREAYPSSTLAQLYDPVLMPPELTQAHRTLDRAVDAAYSRAAFNSEAARLVHLFDRYKQLVTLSRPATQAAAAESEAVA